MYKFKAANERDIDTLLQNQLWVSTLEKMNDPMDLGFYIKSRKVTSNDIIEFQNRLNKSFVVISLTTEFINRRLWNYYTEGMKGFVLAYRNDDLIKALKNAGATDIKYGKILYVENKQELSEMIEAYIKSGSMPEIKDSTLLFSKDTSWEAEHEYRIVAESTFLKRNGTGAPTGMCIDSVIPYQIGVGYKMGKDTLGKIVEYALEHKIEVRRYTPNFRDKSSNSFTNEIIVEGSKIIEKKETRLRQKEKTELDDADNAPKPIDPMEWEKILFNS